MSVTDYIPMMGGDPLADVADSMADLKGDADALALFPYDDGTFYLKPAHFDKELIGGQGGYETEDGDKIVLDGNGEAVKELLGVPILLAIDPTEHAAAVDPVKAVIAHKNNIGEWIKVDKKGNVIEAGQAIEPNPDADVDLSIGPEGSQVEELAQEEQINFDRALSKLEKEGEVRKIMDIAPPGDVHVNGDGIEAEQATHIAVDQSKATDLMPTTTSTTELNTALDKARMEEYEEGKFMKYMLYGASAAFLGETIIVGVMFILFNIF